MNLSLPWPRSQTNDHQDLGGRECDGDASSGGTAGMCGAERQDHLGEGRQCGGISAGSQPLKSRRLGTQRAPARMSGAGLDCALSEP